MFGGEYLIVTLSAFSNGNPSGQQYIHSFNECDRIVDIEHLCDDQFLMAANVDFGLKAWFYRLEWCPREQTPQNGLLSALHLGLPWTTIQGVGPKPNHPHRFCFLSFQFQSLEGLPSGTGTSGYSPLHFSIQAAFDTKPQPRRGTPCHPPSLASYIFSDV